MVQCLLVPACGEDRGGGRDHPARGEGQLPDVVQHRLNPLINRRRIHIGQPGAERAPGDPELFGGSGVHPVTVAAGVQPGHVRGDQLPLGDRERRRAAQQHLVVVQQWPGGLRVSAEHVQQHRILGQRRQVGHGSP
jgi:hypothetical protein